MKLKAILLSMLLCVSADASPTSGTYVAQRDLAPKTGVMYSDLSFKGGETTVIQVWGTSTTASVGCILYKDVEVIASDSNRDRCNITVKPATTAKYTLTIVNNGYSSDKFTIIIQ